MKTIYLMRHGQTLFNVQKKNQGWCDSPLTQTGIAQAKIAGQYFKKNHVQLDSAYSSTSERACDTLEIVTENKMPYKRIKGLKEWNFGAFEGKDSFLNPKLPFGDFFKNYGGEGEKEFQNRFVNAVKEIADNDPNNTILIVAHGAACAQFARYWQDYGDVKYRPGITNCAIFKYEYDDNIFYLKEIIEHDFSSLT